MNTPELSIVINTYNRPDFILQLLSSIYKSDVPKNHEVIIVDDFSEIDSGPKIKKKYPHIVWIRNTKREYLIKSRNKGWKKSKAPIVFFVDDDNEIKDKHFFSRALDTLRSESGIGLLGCRTYYFDEPKLITVGPNSFNKFSGRITFFGLNKKDTKALSGILDTFDNPNAFFTTQAILKKTGGFSEEIVQTMSEADFSEKVRSINKRVVQHSELKVYHKAPRIQLKQLSTRHMGNSPERLYFLMRNKFVFIKKWGSISQKCTFTLFFSHIYTAYYLYMIVRLRAFSYLPKALKGVRDGYIYMLTGILRNSLKTS